MGGTHHFKPTGEFRNPKQGEWYLSGAIVEAYKASNDLSTPYHIATEIHLKDCPMCGGCGKVEVV